MQLCSMETDELAQARASLRIKGSGTNWRTSQRQFEIMISFMEKQQGDISKLPVAERTRTWQRLAELLEAAKEEGVPARSMYRWKKVWSDLKMNTKRKAQRLIRQPSAERTSWLSKPEVRVLRIIGMIKKSIPGSALHRVPAPSLKPASPAPPSTPHSPSSPPSPCSPPAPSASPQPDEVVLTSPAAIPDHIYELTFDEWGRQVSQDPLTEPKSEAEGQADLSDHGDSFFWPEAPSPADLTDQIDVKEQVDLTEQMECTEQMETGLSEPEVPAERCGGALPALRGHTSTRGVRVRGSRVSVLRWAFSERRRRDAELRVRTAELRAQLRLQSLCHRAITLLETCLDRSRGERARARGGRLPSRPMVLHPDRDY